jgi:acetoin utilization deacetylase AcuC-like enzyme
MPLAPGDGSTVFRHSWDFIGLPAIEAFKPDLLLISAGFDAHRADPLAQLRLDTHDFGWITDRLLAVADASAQGRVVSVLEGGYDLDALAASAAEHVRHLLRL